MEFSTMTGIRKIKRENLAELKFMFWKNESKNYQDIGSFFDILKKMTITYHSTHR